MNAGMRRVIFLRIIYSHGATTDELIKQSRERAKSGKRGPKTAEKTLQKQSMLLCLCQFAWYGLAFIVFKIRKAILNLRRGFNGKRNNNG